VDSNSTRRIALRLTPQEDDEINDFLSTSLRFKSKSELIRAAVYAYTRRPQEQQTSVEDSEVKLSRATLNTLDQMVTKGLFKDRYDAIEFIIRKVNEEHFLPMWLNKLVRGYLDDRNLLNFEDLPFEEKSEERQRGEKSDR
jgi:Arc/MetJ-type ribon-helix-helix transcriptional regulator